MRLACLLVSAPGEVRVSQPRPGEGRQSRGNGREPGESWWRHLNLVTSVTDSPQSQTVIDQSGGHQERETHTFCPVIDHSGANQEGSVIDNNMADGSQDMSLVTYTEMPAVVNHEEVFSIVNYNVSDEIDEGYSTNYSPSSKSTSSFECDTSFERTENVSSNVNSNDVQVQYVTGHIGERVEDEKGNMMWLVDFKLDFLNDIEKTGEKRAQDCVPLDSNKRIKLCEVQDTCLPVEDHEAPLNLSHFSQHPPQSQPPLQPHLQPPASVVTEPETAQEGSKPNYTYTDLITLALRDKTALTVSGIYQWIS